MGLGMLDIGHQGAPPASRSSGNGRARGAVKTNVAVLAPDQSAVLRDRLLGEVAAITEGDKAAIWARGVLAAKNSLTAADAKLVEDAFEQRSAGLLEAVVSQEPEAPQDPLVRGSTKPCKHPTHPASGAVLRLSPIIARISASCPDRQGRSLHAQSYGP
jgi:hypothetical protein